MLDVIFKLVGPMHRLRPLPLALLVMAFSPPFAALAEDHSAGKRHHVSVILGNTQLVEEGHDGFTFGMDYEYLLNDRLGIGFVAEHAFDDLDVTAAFAVADVHITHSWVVQLGPGVEIEHGEAYYVGRLGTYYEFEVSEFTVAPQVAYDLSEIEDSVVYGLLIGRMF